MSVASRLAIRAMLGLFLLFGLAFTGLSWLPPMMSWPIGIFILAPSLVGALIGLAIRKRMGLAKTNREFFDLFALFGGVVAGANFSTFVWPGIG